MAEITFTPLKHEHAEVQKMHTNLVYYGDSGVVLRRNNSAKESSQDSSQVSNRNS